MFEAGEEAGEARSKQQATQQATSITGHVSEALPHACYLFATRLLYACYMLAYCLLNACYCYIILCEACPRTELSIRDRCSEILPKSRGGGPGARGSRPLGEIGCFWTTFLGSDPSKPGIPPSKKTPPRHWGELSNALAFLGRAPFLSGEHFRFWVQKRTRAMVLDMS